MTKIVQIKQTRIQREKRLLIQKAALQVFSEFGLRGATLDKIAKACGLTKPNILYYRDSMNGKVIAAENNKISDLNKELHSND